MNKMKKSLIFAFGFIGQIGFATALPLVVFGLLGRYLDGRFGTAPYLFLVGLASATVLIYFILKKLVKDAIKEFDKINKEQ